MSPLCAAGDRRLDRLVHVLRVRSPARVRARPPSGQEEEDQGPPAQVVQGYVLRHRGAGATGAGSQEEDLPGTGQDGGPRLPRVHAVCVHRVQLRLLVQIRNGLEGRAGSGRDMPVPLSECSMAGDGAGPWLGVGDKVRRLDSVGQY